MQQCAASNSGLDAPGAGAVAEEAVWEALAVEAAVWQAVAVAGGFDPGA